MHNLRQRSYERWGVVKTAAHFKLCKAKPLGQMTCLVINLSKGFHVIRDKCNWHDANLAALFGRKLTQRLVERGL